MGGCHLRDDDVLPTSSSRLSHCQSSGRSNAVLNDCFIFTQRSKDYTSWPCFSGISQLWVASIRSDRPMAKLLIALARLRQGSPSPCLKPESPELNAMSIDLYERYASRLRTCDIQMSRNPPSLLCLAPPLLFEGSYLHIRLPSCSV